MIKIENTKDVARYICRSLDVSLDPEHLKQFAAILEPQKLIRGKNPVNEGDVCRCIYYLTYGLVLQYYKRDGVTVTENMAHEGDMIVCIESFFRQEPSNLTLTTLEPSVLYGIPHDELYQLASTSFEFCQLVFAIEQRMLIQTKQWADVIRFDSAKERYVRLMRENPEIVRRAPLHHVASLLQITPETLSRVRNQVNMELY
ncbi:MAG: Crp/Fnr family transcriptional regulator [Bacteroidaceae bacterium]|nr:Crp/Fnr family transcriptional regulator [Bacteroidaceae bacterium]